MADGLDYHGIRDWPHLWERWNDPAVQMGLLIESEIGRDPGWGLKICQISIASPQTARAAVPAARSNFNGIELIPGTAPRSHVDFQGGCLEPAGMVIRSTPFCD